MANLLIVDDKDSIRDSFSFHFQAIGWHAEVARDGQEAIDLIEKKGTFFEGIILDKNMPRKTGDQVVAWLYDHELLEDICVVLLTGFPEMPSAIDALRMGVWQYLIKDMTPTQIQTFIAPGIAQKLVHRIRRSLWGERDLSTVLDRIEKVVAGTLAADGFHVIFLSPYLSRDLSTGTHPNPKRAFVDRIVNGARFIFARSKAEAAALEPVLPGAGTLMAVPVNLDGRLLGVLEIESLKESAFDPRLKDVLIYFAEIISMTQVIHEHRLHAEEKVKLAEERARQKELERTNDELHHRIANSLGIIKQSARDLKREILPDSARERVGYVLAHSIRIENVLVELKDLSTPRPVTVETIDVASLVRGVFEERLPRPEDVGVELPLNHAPVCALADQERLRDALACLANNSFEAIEERRPRDTWQSKKDGAPRPAQEAAPAKYWIKVNLSEDNDSVSIAIADNGVGFDEEIRTRLFNPLFSTKNRRENLHKGYGLYTSERVIKAMSGSIDASSAGPYRGATFTIRLLKPKD